MKVLVAGSTGYLGRFVVQEFKRRGHWIRALEASVTEFLYVSVYNGQIMEHLAIIKAHEDFVRALQASGLQHSIIRPPATFPTWASTFRWRNRGGPTWRTIYE